MNAGDSQTASSGHREPTLDGIRGIAVLMVIAYHALVFGGAPAGSRVDAVFNTILSAGWMGVDLFFVLSGFLITGILCDAREKERYFRTFYVRRFLRIVPACYFFLLWYVVVGQRIIPASEAPQLTRTSLAWAASYVSNYPTGLIGWSVLPHPLRHLWSLAVEEQFYLFWPIFVYALPWRRLMGLCILAILAAWCVKVALLIAHLSVASYVWLPPRLGPLALGSVVALAVREPRILAKLRDWAPPAILLTCGAVFGVWLWRRTLSHDDVAVQLVVVDAVAVLFAATILLAITSAPASLLYRLLARDTLRSIGRYSYAMYLFHQPLILSLVGAGLSAAVLPRIRGSSSPAVAGFVLISIAVSFAAAIGSWHLLEKHALRLKEGFSYGPGVKPSARAASSLPSEESASPSTARTEVTLR